jgi:26S proteasome regulatory subunit N3
MTVKDAKMEDTKKVEEKKEADKEEEPAAVAPPMPPLQSAARRLERLLGGGLSEKDRQLYTYSNPAKVVRRWLGYASGAAAEATSGDIAAAVTALLDPNDVMCGHGRALLLEVCDSPESATDMEIDGSSTAATDEKKKDEYLTTASNREIETWLLSLQVRLYWKQEKYTEAFNLVEKGIAMLLGHLDAATKKMTSAVGVSISSLFPLLARLYRYRSLVADAVKDPNMVLYLRTEMSKAHNMACLRRDFDSQATLLNLMLRDLLQHSQSKFGWML